MLLYSCVSLCCVLTITGVRMLIQWIKLQQVHVDVRVEVRQAKSLSRASIMIWKFQIINKYVMSTKSYRAGIKLMLRADPVRTIYSSN